MALKITTCQIKKTNEMRAQGWTVIDVTVKSGEPTFNPSWKIVMGVKNNTITEEEYTQTYRQMMLSSWKQNRARWLEVLGMEKVCLACYCSAPPTFCHRHLLAEYLKKAASTQGIECEIIPEGKKAEQLTLAETTKRGITPKNITSLKKGEVFVFGSNGQGFHGAGAAGMAFRGESSNTWREDKAFLAAMNAPKGSPERVGKWAIFGVARGYMEGKEGASYAIQTVVKPGAKRSMDLEEILNQLKEMAHFAAEHPEMTFLCTITGGGYNGYTVGDMRGVYRSWEDGYPIPMNITFPEEML